MYEAACGICEDESQCGEGGGGKKVKLKFGECYPEKNVYVGETSRSIFERSQEHAKAGKGKREESFAKNWQENHPERDEMPKFIFKLIRSFKDPLSRQISESVKIDLRWGVLNSETMLSRNSLPRLTIEKSEWEKKKGEREKENEKRELKENKLGLSSAKLTSSLAMPDVSNCFKLDGLHCKNCQYIHIRNLNVVILDTRS